MNDMRYVLKELYAYRFFEQKDGPLDTIRKYALDEISTIGRNAGITNLEDIYHNRVNIENLMLNLFKRSGGQPCISYPYYFAIYDRLPSCNKLHVRFQKPMCLKIPMTEFHENLVSFTYGLSAHAFTRKDNHPCRRKLLMWKEAEQVINELPFDEDEDIWIEMQVWDKKIIQNYYIKEYDTAVSSFEVEERLSDSAKEALNKKYEDCFHLISLDYFHEPYGVHGINHAKRVLVLANELANNNILEEQYNSILSYCASYHDIGREHNFKDDNHGYKSYHKMLKHDLVPSELNLEQQELLRFIIENHPFTVEIAETNLKNYLIKDRDSAIKVFCIFRDADILDRCRFGHVNKHYLYLRGSRNMVPFAFQLLHIYKEIIYNA